VLRCLSDFDRRRHEPGTDAQNRNGQRVISLATAAATSSSTMLSPPLLGEENSSAPGPLLLRHLRVGAAIHTDEAVVTAVKSVFERFAETGSARDSGSTRKE
jgi:hypothetical protein